MYPWIPFDLLPADTLPEWILIILAVLDLLLKILALGWIPHQRRPSVALAWLLAIFLMPYAGLLLFVVIGSTRLPRKRMAKQARMNHVIQENTPERLPHGLAHRGRVLRERELGIREDVAPAAEKTEKKASKKAAKSEDDAK